MRNGVAGGGAGGDRPWQKLCPLSPPMKLHFVQKSMESRHCESQSAPLLTPEPPLLHPHFEMSGYTPDHAVLMWLFITTLYLNIVMWLTLVLFIVMIAFLKIERQVKGSQQGVFSIGHNVMLPWIQTSPS